MAKENGHEKAGSGTPTAIGPSIIIKGKLKSDEDLIVKAIRREFPDHAIVAEMHAIDEM